jgi:hypothetical protein
MYVTSHQAVVTVNIPKGTIGSTANLYHLEVKEPDGVHKLYTSVSGFLEPTPIANGSYTVTVNFPAEKAGAYIITSQVASDADLDTNNVEVRSIGTAVVIRIVQNGITVG